jgi:hypothetical protein
MSTQFGHGFALLIGVGADLPNTVDDALGLADILKDPLAASIRQGRTGSGWPG